MVQLSPLETSFKMHLLPRVNAFHVVCVDIDVRYELVEDAPGRVHNPVCHLRGYAH